MNNGFLNEYKIANKLNNKKIKNLPVIYKEMISVLFPVHVEEDLVKCYVDTNKRKYDIVLSINNEKKYISIKLGSKNSFHAEKLSNFINFLRCSNISEDVINKYLHYHFADGTYDGSGSYKMSINEYKEKYYQNIEDINQEFIDKNFFDKAIKRFVLQGTRTNYKMIDGILHGNEIYFEFYTTNYIYNLLKFYINNQSSGVHISLLFIMPMSRCLNCNSKYLLARNNVQIKWFNIQADILNKTILDFYNENRNVF